MKFVPVNVSRGRKFRGDCYIIDGEYTRYFGYGKLLNGADYVKVWIPETRTTAWVNKSFPVERVVPTEQLNADFEVYAKTQVESVYEWCSRKEPNASREDVLSFARRVVAKRDRELLPVFDKTYGTKEDVVGEVKSILNWAFGLGYGNAKSVRVALRVLTKKGLVGKAGFNSAWHIFLDLRGLGKYADKYLPEKEVA